MPRLVAKENDLISQEKVVDAIKVNLYYRLSLRLVEVHNEKFSPYEDAMALFEKLDWSLSPEDIENRTDNIITNILSVVEEIEGIPAEERTFENTILALERVKADNGDLGSTVTFPSSISIDSDIRNASNQAKKKLSDFYVELGLRETLYDAVMEYVDKGEDLSVKDQRLVDFIVRDFKRQGFHLEKEDRIQLKDLFQDIVKFGIEFRQNVDEWDVTLEFTEEELEGTPGNILNSLEKTDDGKFIVELTSPNMIGITTNCSVENTRKELTKAWNSRCIGKNTELLDTIVKLRHEAAQLLGYDNHAEYGLEIKMANDPETAIEFVYDLIERLQPHGKKELEILSELKAEEVGENGDSTIYLHDRTYYSRIWKEREFDVNMEKVKEYFPLTHVLNAMLEFYQDIFDFTFVQIEDAPVWHDDVMCYAIYDNDTSKFKGVFYLDLFPRPGTFGHAAAFSLVKGRLLENGEYQDTASAMVCNFNKPTEEEPSLLTLGQVRTLFHEFGHIIHQTTTTAKHYRFSGTSVQRDFVEAPSQMLENWIYEEEVITKISNHYKTDEPIPFDLVDRLRDYSRALPGLVNLRQLFFGSFDLKVHTTMEPNTRELYNEMMKEVSLIDAPENSNGSASFGHIALGYDAGYYGYMWSNTIAQDLYTRFKTEGPTSKEVGRDYRTYILEPGNEKDANELVELYLGRPFNNQAFMEYLGLN